MTTTAFSHIEEELKNTYYLYFLTDFFYIQCDRKSPQKSDNKR